MARVTGGCRLVSPWIRDGCDTPQSRNYCSDKVRVLTLQTRRGYSEYGPYLNLTGTSSIHLTEHVLAVTLPTSYILRSHDISGFHFWLLVSSSHPSIPARDGSGIITNPPPTAS